MADDLSAQLSDFDPLDLARAAAEPIRLAVLGASVTGRVSIDDLASGLGVERKAVAEAVGYLRSVGLLDDSAALDRQALSTAAKALPRPDNEPVEIEPGLWSQEELDILDRFFAGSRLMSIPSAFAKRKLVLEKVVQEFEPGVRYPERDVNFKIQLINADYAAIRRYLVDEAFLDRADGVYWRIGGRYAPGLGAASPLADLPTVSTARDDVLLVPYTTSMIDDLARVANDDAVSRYLADHFPYPYTRKDAEEFVHASLRDALPMNYAIVFDGGFAGGIGGGRRNAERTGTFEIGWWLGTAMWGRGITSAAAAAYVDLLFSGREAMRVEATVMGTNEASKRVAEKAGLFLEGISPNAYLKRGVRYDAFIFGVDRPTWQSRR